MKKNLVYITVFMLIFGLTTRSFAANTCEENCCPINQEETNSEIQEAVKEETGITIPAEEVKEEKVVKEVKVTKEEVEISEDKVELEKITSELKDFFAQWEKYQNKHNINALKKLYLDEYINSDGYNKNQLFKLMNNTFENYPNITSVYEIKEITPGKDFSSIILSQTVSATTKTPSKITGDNGDYSANIKLAIYLKKVNNVWKIYSEHTLSEFSTLTFGTAKGINVQLSVPQKVLANSDYCAGIKVDIPTDYNAIASINATQLVEDYKLNGENFRQLQKNNPTLERVLKANSSNNNETVVVSVGFAEQTHDMFKKTKIDLSGLLMLTQRVDVIPLNSNFTVSTGKNSAKK